MSLSDIAILLGVLVLSVILTSLITPLLYRSKAAPKLGAREPITEIPLSRDALAELLKEMGAIILNNTSAPYEQKKRMLDAYYAWSNSVGLYDDVVKK